MSARGLLSDCYIPQVTPDHGLVVPQRVMVGNFLLPSSLASQATRTVSPYPLLAIESAQYSPELRSRLLNHGGIQMHFAKFLDYDVKRKDMRHRQIRLSG
jgi:hypothetical protein